MTLEHDDVGTGPAVVLVHSGVCDRRMWDGQWAALTGAGHRVVRCDLRGFGDTPAAGGPYSDAEDIRDLLDTLGIGSAALVGSSYGGRISLELAARWPDRVDALALLCAGRPGHVPGPELRAFGAREDSLIEGGDLTGAVEVNVEMWLGPDADAAAREAVRVMQRRAFEVQLAAGDAATPVEADVDLSTVTAPCLAVSGAHDAVDFRRIAAELPELLGAAARHVELPWAGHLPNLERPTEIAALLLDFLRDPR